MDLTTSVHNRDMDQLIQTISLFTQRKGLRRYVNLSIQVENLNTITQELSTSRSRQNYKKIISYVECLFLFDALYKQILIQTAC